MVADPNKLDGKQETIRFARLGFDKFKTLASDETLSDNEKIGFPDALREGFDEAIWADIRSKLPALDREGARIADIGCGCGPLPHHIIDHAVAREQTLALVDHREMLDLLPDAKGVCKVDGRFPENRGRIEQAINGQADVILVYSVLQVVAIDANPFAFLDGLMLMLSEGGEILIGDIANQSRLRRFLASEAGRQHHKAYMRTASEPDLPPFAIAEDRLDDSVVLGLVSRARAAGFDAYILPQPETLPMSNRREDILIRRP